MPASNAVDIETVRAIAELAATTAAVRAGELFRVEMQRGFIGVENSFKSHLETMFKMHFGDMTPDQHLVQHSRLATLLESLDSTRKNIWKTVTTKVTEYAIIGVMAYLAFTYGTSH